MTFTAAAAGAGMPAAALAQKGRDAVAPTVRPPEIVAPVQEPPSPADVLGHELGERFTDHDAVVRYMRALAEASPRVELRPYGETVEGRALLQVVIAREDRLAGLDAILARNRELADPATSVDRAGEIAASNPAVVYFSYGVHGNESSSSEAALWTAWELASGEPRVEGVLDSLVVVIDPAVNPDGRDRYVDWYRQARSLEPNPRPEAREHREPWPGGRYNHYLFDLNRDWTWLTQPETRARIATWDEWTPQVHVDFHEMSWRSTYFFFPATEPINPLYPEHIREWGRYFGEANAAAFDERGWLYFTDESYDLFYPGYGDSWPSLLGAIGMTYEQAGSGRAGLVVERPDGSRLTLRDRALHHWTSGVATLTAAAARKDELLGDFAAFHRRVGSDLPDILLVPGENTDRAEALVRLLTRQGIRVERATQPFGVDAEPHRGFAARREFPAGSYRVPARQRRGLLAVTLLQPETTLNATFSYDISAWSLPYAYGVEAHMTDEAPAAAWAPVEPGDLQPEERVTRARSTRDGSPGESAGPNEARGAAGTPTTAASALAASGPDATPPARGRRNADARTNDRAHPTASAAAGPYGHLVAPRLSAWPALVRYLEAGGRATLLDEPFTAADRSWPAGTIFLPRSRTEGQEAKLESSGLSAHAHPVHSGLTEDGHDLGTQEAYTIELPRTAVVMGDGISPTSYGAHWFFLERTLGLPFDAVRTEWLEQLPLDVYDVLVIPDAGGGALSTAAIDRLTAWVRDGGTLVAVDGGARAVAEPLAEVRPREADETAGETTDDGLDDDADAAIDRALRGREARELERWQERVPGTVLSVRLDPAHPLAFGVGIGAERDRLFVLHRGGLVFEPDEAFETVAHFPEALEKVSGVITDANLDRRARGSWLVSRGLGGGQVILFADDPLFRHFWRAAFLPYVNALMLGPAL